MHYQPLFTAATVCAAVCGCASPPPPLDAALQPTAVKAAQQLGTSELACSAVTSEVLSKQIVEEAQRTGWRDLPHRAEYTIGISGCGKRAIYSVTCDKERTQCDAAPAVPVIPPPQLADELQPDAMKAALQRGSKELDCAGATATVTRKDTIQEPQTTGWYTVPYRALYTISVAGCDKQTSYAVACNKKEGACVAGSVLPPR